MIYKTNNKNRVSTTESIVLAHRKENYYTYFSFLFVLRVWEETFFFFLIPDVVTNLKRFIQTLESLLMTSLIWEKCWALYYRKFHNYEMVVLQTFRHKMSIGISYFRIGKKLMKEEKNEHLRSVMLATLTCCLT